jgi:VanZ family protein
VAWVCAICYLVLLFVLSHNSLRGIRGPRFPHSDKVAHAVAYAGLSAALYWAFRSTRRGWLFRWAAPAAFVAASLYGITDEWHQSWGPGGRSPDVWDWVADTVGAAVMMTAVVLLRRRGLGDGPQNPSQAATACDKPDFEKRHS